MGINLNDVRSGSNLRKKIKSSMYTKLAVVAQFARIKVMSSFRRPKHRLHAAHLPSSGDAVLEEACRIVL